MGAIEGPLQGRLTNPMGRVASAYSGEDVKNSYSLLGGALDDRKVRLGLKAR